MATFTASQFRSVVAAPHIGTVWTGGAVSPAVTGTASSVVLLCEVPQHATIVDWWLYIQTGGVDQTVQLGTSASPSGICPAFSLCQSISVTFLVHSNIRAPGPGTQALAVRMPVRISLSDDVVPAKVWVQAELGSAISASASIVFMLAYNMERAFARTTIR